jgi:hypothetical protein
MALLPWQDPQLPVTPFELIVAPDWQVAFTRLEFPPALARLVELFEDL